MYVTAFRMYQILVSLTFTIDYMLRFLVGEYIFKTIKD